MISSKSRLTEHRHGPMNRMRAVSPELERVPNKKTKLKEISPKRRPKRVISPPPEKLRRPEVALPAKKSKDKADKVRADKVFQTEIFLTTKVFFRPEHVSKLKARNVEIVHHHRLQTILQAVKVHLQR